jgi:hypothetical protein
MSSFGTRYPIVFQAVMNHAQRLRSFLEEREGRLLESDAGARWLIGRAGEVQCVVALIALDWHQERLSSDAAATKLARYVREIHDGLAMHLDIGMPPCCRVPIVRANPRPERSRKPPIRVHPDNPRE